MSNGSGSLGATHLLAYLSDGESAASIRALMNRQNITNFAVEPGTVSEATEFLKGHPSPHTLVVEVPNAETAPRLLDALADVVNPGTRVIVTGKVDTFSFYHWLLGLGIHDYLLQPFNEQQLASALIKGTAGAAPVAAAEKDTSPRKMVAFIGARGGVGTTTVATTVASIIANDFAMPTALVDMDAQFGSIALGLDLEPSRGLRDALEKPDRIDSLFLERVMMKPSPLLSILSAEEQLSELVTPHAQAGELLFAALREKFPMIVVDLPRQMNPLSRYVLSHADQVVVVAEPSLLALRDTLRLKDLVVETFKRPVPQVLINREGYSKQEPSRSEFTKHLEIAPIGYVPYAAGVIGAAGRGDDVAKDSKLKNVTAPLRVLAEQLSGKTKPQDEPGKKGKPKGSK